VERRFKAPKASRSEVRGAESVKRVENGEGVYVLFNQLEDLGKRREPHSGIQDEAPAENRFQYFPSVKECLSLREV